MSINERLAARAAECQAMARQLEPDFPLVTVELFTGRRAAGLARLQANVVGINEVLLRENPEPMLRDTVAHEFAHLLVYWRWSQLARGACKRPQPHGCQWQNIMRMVFGVAPERTHQFDVSNTGARSQRRIDYTCGCGMAHPVSTVKHNRILRGANYRCIKCGTRITLKATK